MVAGGRVLEEEPQEEVEAHARLGQKLAVGPATRSELLRWLGLRFRWRLVVGIGRDSRIGSVRNPRTRLATAGWMGLLGQDP